MEGAPLSSTVGDTRGPIKRAPYRRVGVLPLRFDLRSIGDPLEFRDVS